MITLFILVVFLSVSSFAFVIPFSNKKCGRLNRSYPTCPVGECCSKDGYCGNQIWYCDSLCQNNCPNYTTPENVILPAMRKNNFPANNNIVLGKEYSNCFSNGLFTFTFDDGPMDSTSEILDYLLTKNISATFFVVANHLLTPKYAELMRRAYNENHQIAMHSWDHSSLLFLKDSEVDTQISMQESMFKKYLGFVPVYMRAPYGETNANILKKFADRNYRVIYWNMDVEDYEQNQLGTLSEIYIASFQKKILEFSKNDSSIISLNHDVTLLTANNIAKLTDIVEKSGFKFVTASQCLQDPVIYKTIEDTFTQSYPNQYSSGEKLSFKHSFLIFLFVNFSFL